MTNILKSVATDQSMARRQSAAINRALDLLTADSLDAPDLAKQIEVGRLKLDQDTRVRHGNRVTMSKRYLAADMQEPAIRKLHVLRAG